jgi:hypothetical protein
LWETALRFARRETDTNATCKHNHAKRDTSIQAFHVTHPFKINIQSHGSTQLSTTDHHTV